MEKSIIFCKIPEEPDGDLSWNGKPFKKLRGTRVQFGDKEIDFNNQIQQTVSNVSADLGKFSKCRFIKFY